MWLFVRLRCRNDEPATDEVATQALFAIAWFTCGDGLAWGYDPSPCRRMVLEHHCAYEAFIELAYDTGTRLQAGIAAARCILNISQTDSVPLTVHKGGRSKGVGRRPEHASVPRDPDGHQPSLLDYCACR